MGTPLWLEYAKLALQTLTFLVAGGGLIYAARQLGLAVTAYRDLHDWNRRKAAQDAVEKYKDIQADNFLLHEKFRVMESSDPIPLQTVKDACTADPNVRSAIHRRLNYFENLSVGCRHGVYDEVVVQSALETLFTNTLSQFQPYVDHRRANGSLGFGIEFETLTGKWRTRRDALSNRRQTGAA